MWYTIIKRINAKHILFVQNVCQFSIIWYITWSDSIFKQNCKHVKKNKIENSPCIYHGVNRLQDFDIKFFCEYTTHLRRFRFKWVVYLIRSLRITRITWFKDNVCEKIETKIVKNHLFCTFLLSIIYKIESLNQVI